LTPLAAAVLRVDRSPERVLAIAADEGEAALFLAREFPVARVRGVDTSERRVRAASARVGLDREGRIAFKAGRPGALPFPDAFFDLVALLDGRPAAAELARVLRPGGYLILARTRQARAARGIAARPPRRRLGRHGIELLEAGEAGDGSFSVGRLRSGDPAPGAE
jgi:SAM-dependent methyltransferase